MSNGIDTLLKAIPEDDQYCNLKRAEIRRWYDSCGIKVLNSESEDFAASILYSDKYWSGYKLNRTAFGQELLNDQTNPICDFNRYKLACLLCSKEKVREYFVKLQQWKNTSIEELVIDDLSFRSRLEDFWSHYANIVGVTSPSPIILESLKKMMMRKGLDYSIQDDLWKYGFLCSKEEGCIDALNFFSSKLQNQYEQKDRFLIDTIAHISFQNDRDGAACRIIEFCMENLNPNAYNNLVGEMVRTHNCFAILSRLIDTHLYNYVRELVNCIDPKNVSSREYSNLLHGIGDPAFPTPEESRQFRTDLFIWFWKLETLEKQRLAYLNNLDYISHVSLLIKFIKAGELQLLKMILDSENPEQFKKAMTYLGNGRYLCCALYKKNERIVLSEILNFVENSEKFLSNLDYIVHNHLECALEKQKNICPSKVFDLYVKGKREELLEYIEPVVQTKRGHNQLLHDIDILVLCGFSDMLEGRFQFKEVGNLGSSISSSLGDIQQPICSASTTVMK